MLKLLATSADFNPSRHGKALCACVKFIEMVCKNYKCFELEVVGDFLKFYIVSDAKNIFSKTTIIYERGL